MPGSDRIQSIINASLLYGDHLNAELQRQLDENPDLIIYYHRNCVSRYVTPSNFLKRTYDSGDCEESGNPTRLHCSASPKFEFNDHCLYCVQIYNVKKDPKHPHGWRPAYMFRATESEQRDKDLIPIKDMILENCKLRNDELADRVRIRVQGAVWDIHAAEARYYVDCRQIFYTPGQNLAGCSDDKLIGDDNRKTNEAIKKSLMR